MYVHGVFGVHSSSRPVFLPGMVSCFVVAKIRILSSLFKPQSGQELFFIQTPDSSDQ